MVKDKAKRMSKFRAEWLKRQDTSGDKLGEYIVRVDDWNSRCIWCKSDLFHGGNGISALIQYTRMASHKANADLRKDRNRTQMMFASQDESANNNEDEPVAAVEETSGTGTPGADHPTRNRRTIILNSLETLVTLSRNNYKLCLEDKATAATALLVMKGIEAGWSYSSMESLPAVCARSDPDSDIWKKVSLSRNKNSYIVTNRLYPHFDKILVRDLRSSPGFSLLVDAATFKQQGLSQHCEIKVRFWSSKFNEVRDAFLTYNTVGHETAEQAW